MIKQEELKKILVHIGFHKTGTSWLQQEVFNEDSSTFHRLSELGFHFVFDKDGFVLNSFDLNKTELTRQLNQSLQKRPIDKGKTPVISFERLSGSPYGAGFNANAHAARIKHMFPSAKILIVIREQKSVILSNYFQYLTGGGTHGIKKFLNSRANGLRPFFSPHHFCYHHVIGHYQRLFGSERVLVLPYEHFRDSKQSFLSQLAVFTETKIGLDRDRYEQRINKNDDQFVRYHFRLLMRFVKATELNDFSPLYNRFNARIAWNLFKLLKFITPAYLNRTTLQKLDAAIAHWIGDRYCESNRKTSELTAIDLETIGYMT